MGGQFLWPGLCEEEPITLDLRPDLQTRAHLSPDTTTCLLLSPCPPTCLYPPLAPARLRMRCCCGCRRKRGQLRAASNLCPPRRTGCRGGGGFGGRRNLRSRSRAHTRGPSDGNPGRKKVRGCGPGNRELLCSSLGVVGGLPTSLICFLGQKVCYNVSGNTGEMCNTV